MFGYRNDNQPHSWRRSVWKYMIKKHKLFAIDDKTKLLLRCVFYLVPYSIKLCRYIINLCRYIINLSFLCVLFNILKSSIKSQNLEISLMFIRTEEQSWASSKHTQKGIIAS